MAKKKAAGKAKFGVVLQNKFEHLVEAFGMTEKRGIALQKLLVKTMVKEKKVSKTILAMQELCENINEFTFCMFALGDKHAIIRAEEADEQGIAGLIKKMTGHDINADLKSGNVKVEVHKVNLNDLKKGESGLPGLKPEDLI